MSCVPMSWWRTVRLGTRPFQYATNGTRWPPSQMKDLEPCNPPTASWPKARSRGVGMPPLSLVTTIKVFSISPRFCSASTSLPTITSTSSTMSVFGVMLDAP